MKEKYIKDLKNIIKNKEYEKIYLLTIDNEYTIWSDTILKLIEEYERRNNNG